MATNLVEGVTYGVPQVYRKDMSTGAVVLVSVNGAGQTGDRPSLTPTISGDGTVVAFQTASTSFVSSLNTAQVFTRVLPDGPLTLESAGAAAVGAPSTFPALSSNGRYLAFVSAAPLHPDDRDGNVTLDVFLRDRDPDVGTTVLASLSLNTVAGATSTRPSISEDGRWVAFDSLDEQLVGVDEDTNGSTTCSSTTA